MSAPAKFFSTKAKREAAAARLSELAKELGIECEVKPAPIGDRELWVTFGFGPYRCHTDLDGATQVTAYLAHWYTEAHSTAEYPSDFGIVIGGSVNEYHHRKATTLADNFDGLLLSIREGFGLLKAIMEESNAD